MWVMDTLLAALLFSSAATAMLLGLRDQYDQRRIRRAVAERLVRYCSVASRPPAS